MDITVSSRHVEPPAALVQAARQKLERLAARTGLDRAEVHFTADHARNTAQRDVCEVWARLGGRRLGSKAVADDLGSAFAAAMAKLAHQAQQVDRTRRGRTRSVG